MLQFKLLLIAVCISIMAIAGDGSYAVSSIPEALLKGANVVKRSEEVRFEIVNTGETILYRKYALTILNENGDKHAQFVQDYDKLLSIRSIEGSLYDAQGKLIRKLKNKEIQDYSGVSDISLFEDSRLKAHNFTFKVYPYTVEYEVEIKFNHTFFMPGWLPQSSENLSIESSRFSLIYPTDYKVRYKVINYNGLPSTKTLGNKTVIEWQVRNIMPLVKPFASPLWSELTTAVYLAPSEFELDGYKGNMSTWAEFGKFQLLLNQNRDKLPEEVIQKLQQITSGISDDKEKVNVVYKFLQQNTRYISIQLGIGGWQPFDAAYVAKKGYGDCKALSNYMYSLLKAVGIRSHYTIIRAGRQKEDKRMMDDFPSNQSNHIILCVPLKKDTIWLECTDQFLPAGYLSGFTSNRKALVVTEDGGKIVSTPTYGLKENVQTRSIKSRLNVEGDLEAVVKTVYSGIEQDYVFDVINQLSTDKVKKILNEQLSLSTYDVNDFKYQQRPSSTPEIEEHLKIYITGQATVSGKRIFITPNLLNRSSVRVPEDERIHDFVFDYEYRDIDSVEIEVPEGYTLEATPQDVSLKTKFGTYNSSVKLVGNKVYYLRIREQFAGRFPAKDKDELSKFLETIYKTDKSRVVLVKKGE